jgi:Zn-dependent peptidase ImmA (M78 family)/transcriptional regulator with XRE-family HTH domain
MPDPVAHDLSDAGLRLKAARIAAQVTQDEAATAIGVVRTTIVAIEQGSRRVQAEELAKLADLYKVSVRELLGHDEKIQVEFVPQFRRDLRKSEEARKTPDFTSVHLLERLAVNYLELERMVGKPLTTNYPSEYPLAKGGGEEQAEEIAMAERSRLGVGLGPIGDLLTLLECQVGIRLFTRAIPGDVSGVFAYDEKAGACILINAVHTAGRQTWSGAHDYFHFLTARHKPEVLHGPGHGKSPSERMADHFAGSFLMPAVSVRQQFDSCASVGKFTPTSLFYLAHMFHVSIEAMSKRLEQLRLIRTGTWESLKERGLRVEEARASLGFQEAAPRTNAPTRFLALAVDAHIEGKLSEGETARLLAVDRLTVREWVDQFSGQGASNP